MKNLYFFLISLIIVPAIYFSSCAKVEDDDTVPPIVADAWMNRNDTIIYFNANKERIVVKINDSTKVKQKDGNRKTIDTLIAGKWLYISASFTDETNNLSSFKVGGKLRYKHITKIKGKEKYDSIFSFVKVGRNIFGNKSPISVYNNRLIEIPDTIIVNRRKNNISITDTTVIHTDTIYNLYIVCMDQAGNKDSISNHQVRILHRKTLIDALSK